MNSKEAIDLLTPIVSFDGYENIYKYKAIKDSDQEQLKELIQQQDKMLELAIEWIVDHTGSCPNELYDWPNNCEGECGYGDVDEQMGKCWRKYLQSEVGK